MSLLVTYGDSTKTYENSFWFILTHFDSLWLIWLILTHFDSFWLILTHFDSFWLILTHFDSFWLIKTYKGLFWLLLTPFSCFFLILTKFSSFCSFWLVLLILHFTFLEAFLLYIYDSFWIFWKVLTNLFWFILTIGEIQWRQKYLAYEAARSCNLHAVIKIRSAWVYIWDHSIQVLRYKSGGWVGSENGNFWWFTVL
jgi:hypothetical protein